MTPGEQERLRRMAAKDEIREVLVRLARGTDRRDLELIRSCYHEDSFDDHGGFQGSGHDFAQWVADTLSMFTATMHFLGNSDIRVDGDVALAETYCTAGHLMPADEAGVVKNSIMWLRYLDRFERQEGGPWLIRRRTCVFDWTYMVSSGERWPLDPPFLIGRPDTADPSYPLLG